MGENDIENWWDAASDYYQEEISGDDLMTVRYGPFASTEKKLKLLGNIKGKKILELGCGGGQVSVSLAKKGAVCTGIDISKKQLEYANKLAERERVKIRFVKESFSNLVKRSPAFPDSVFDIVISVFALQYASDLNKVLKGVHRVLKRKGEFVFSVDHPFYLSIDPQTMELSESYNKTGRFDEKDKWPDGSRHTFTMYRRRVSDIVNAITGNGFSVDRILEPFDPEDEVWGQGYRRKLVRMLTPTIIFKCTKI